MKNRKVHVVRMLYSYKFSRRLLKFRRKKQHLRNRPQWFWARIFDLINKGNIGSMHTYLPVFEGWFKFRSRDRLGEGLVQCWWDTYIVGKWAIEQKVETSLLASLTSAWTKLRKCLAFNSPLIRLSIVILVGYSIFGQFLARICFLPTQGNCKILLLRLFAWNCGGKGSVHME